MQSRSPTRCRWFHREHGVLIEQVELVVVAVAGARIADFRVGAVDERVDNHLSDLVAEHVGVNLFSRPAAGRVVVVSDREVFAEHEAVAIRRAVVRDGVERISFVHELRTAPKRPVVQNHNARVCDVSLARDVCALVDPPLELRHRERTAAHLGGERDDIGRDLNTVGAVLPCIPPNRNGRQRGVAHRCLHIGQADRRSGRPC